MIDPHTPRRNLPVYLSPPQLHPAPFLPALPPTLRKLPAHKRHLSADATHPRTHR